MNINLMPLLIVGAVLLLMVTVLAVWRKIVSLHEDDTLHVLEGGAVVQNQEVMARKLAVIERWGKALTLVTLVYALGVAVLYFYQTWMRGSSSTGM